MGREKQFENKIKNHLKESNAWFLKTWSNGVQREGVPDILASVNGFFIGIEVKAENGTPSELQLWNIDEIRKSNGIGIVLYPHQYNEFKKLIKNLMAENWDDAFNDQYKFDKERE